MSEENYRYLLPVFVGHPFQAEYTPELRRTLQRVCTNLTAEQSASDNRFLWRADFANEFTSTSLKTILTKVRNKIRESALAVFEISDASNANVFFELGMAVGMNRRVILVGKKPFKVPADISGYEGIEYEDASDLENKVSKAFEHRLLELQRIPSEDIDVTYQKMQIDSCWVEGIRRAADTICFFSGDVSWVEKQEPHLQHAASKGVRLQVCGRLPRRNEDRKWDNIERLSNLGAEVRLFESSKDPEVRGFITDPERLWKSEALFVERHNRYEFDGEDVESFSPSESDGRPNTELDYIYQAQIFRGKNQPELVAAMIRLFEMLWESPSLSDFTSNLRDSI